ncbi:MAG: metallophosphoesterase family protein [Limnochordia bacterium]|jgi:predicted phosphodiesterase
MERDQRFASRRKYLPALSVVLGALVCASLFSESSYEAAAFVVELDASLGTRGLTRFVLPPVGSISAATHPLPIQLTITLQSIDLAILRTIVFSESDTIQAVIDSVPEWTAAIVLRYVVRLVVLGALGAAIGAWLAGLRRPRALALGVLSGALVVGLVIALTYATFDQDAFANPEYNGIIEAAPWMFELVQDSLDRVEELGKQIQTVAGNLYAVFANLENVGQISLGRVDLLVLHVSDIHNNPVAYDFARQVIGSFPVDLVIDTGDLTDWGTELEAEITSRISELNVPYVFATGNHDSPDVVARLRQTANVVLVEDGEEEIMGLRIVGLGDPAAQRYSPQPAGLDELHALAQAVNEKWAQVENRPDIFMVHNHRIAGQIEPGLFPVVLCGHSHALEVTERSGTFYINAGTTGAAGIRGFQSREPLPYSLALLHYARNALGKLELVAVDGVHVSGFGSGFSLQRTFTPVGRIRRSDVETQL